MISAQEEQALMPWSPADPPAPLNLHHLRCCSHQSVSVLHWKLLLSRTCPSSFSLNPPHRQAQPPPPPPQRSALPVQAPLSCFPQPRSCWPLISLVINHAARSLSSGDLFSLPSSFAYRGKKQTLPGASSFLSCLPSLTSEMGPGSSVCPARR